MRDLNFLVAEHEAFTAKAIALLEEIERTLIQERVNVIASNRRYPREALLNKITALIDAGKRIKK